MRKVTIDTARLLFAERGCTLLSKRINNVRELLAFICTCGRTAQISYDKFRSGQLCGGCRWERGSGKLRHSIDSVRIMFSEQGCDLLSSAYSDNKQKLEYRCNCGTISSIAFSKFKAGQRCGNCKCRKISEKLTGPNNPSWRDDLTDEDRIKERTIPGYDKWRMSVFERDGFTCVACGSKGGKVNAHHLESYARVPESRTDINNGATLCVPCHREYHRNIRHNDADAESFKFFITVYNEPWYAGEKELGE